MWNLNARNTLGGIAVAATCLLIAGCYTQIRTDVVKVEPVREPPQTRLWTDDLSVTTDQAWYERPHEDREVTVGATFENNGFVPVLLSGCPDPPALVVENWDGAEWRDGLWVGLVCPAIYSRQTVKIEPGEALDFEIRLSDSGWCRLRLLVGPDADHPIAVVHSNQFLIK